MPLKTVACINTASLTQVHSPWLRQCFTPSLCARVCAAQARALGVAAATAGVAFSTTAMPAQGAHFLHIITYAIWLVRIASTASDRLA